MKRYFLVTNDVESTSIVNNKLSNSTAEKVFRDGMPRLLELYAKHNIRSTFFYTAEIAVKYPEIVKMVLADGHEVGCHGYSHEDAEALDHLNLQQQIELLDRSKKVLEDLSGQKVISFRAPALRVNEFTPAALESTGFQIDSSVASQRFDFFMSYGALHKLRWLTAPRTPYRTARNDLATRGNSGIIEVPISALILPYVGSFIRLFPAITGGLRWIIYTESKFNGKPLNLLIHPNELIVEQRDKSVHRRANNIFQYLIADLIRTNLKVKNLGDNALLLFEKQIEFFTSKGFEFTTISDFVNSLSI